MKCRVAGLALIAAWVIACGDAGFPCATSPACSEWASADASKAAPDVEPAAPDDHGASDGPADMGEDGAPDHSPSNSGATDASSDASQDVGPDPAEGADGLDTDGADQPAQPTPSFLIEEGTAVTPPTMLHLHAPDNVGPEPVTAVRWAVDQPTGSVSLVVPSVDYPHPTFEANVAGAYTFRLEVWDANGARTVLAPLTVMATPYAALHVELLWDTPGDPDQTDGGVEAGADLDLHFVHPSAAGPDFDGDGVPEPWFDQPFDCFWFNPMPAWGSPEPTSESSPALVRADTDGAGPEILTMHAPEDGAVYRIGVHSWHDHKYGASLATLRVYIGGELAWERAGVELHPRQLWDAVTLSWPSGVVTPVVGPGGIDKIFEDLPWQCFTGPCW